MTSPVQSSPLDNLTPVAYQPCQRRMSRRTRDSRLCSDVIGPSRPRPATRVSSLQFTRACTPRLTVRSHVAFLLGIASFLTPPPHRCTSPWVKCTLWGSEAMRPVAWIVTANGDYLLPLDFRQGSWLTSGCSSQHEEYPATESIPLPSQGDFRFQLDETSTHAHEWQNVL